MKKVKITYTLHDPIYGHKYTKTVTLGDPFISFSDGTRFEDVFIGGNPVEEAGIAYTFIPLACVNSIGGLNVVYADGKDYCDRRNDK